MPRVVGSTWMCRHEIGHMVALVSGVGLRGADRVDGRRAEVWGSSEAARLRWCSATNSGLTCGGCCTGARRDITSQAGGDEGRRAAQEAGMPQRFQGARRGRSGPDPPSRVTELARRIARARIKEAGPAAFACWGGRGLACSAHVSLRLSAVQSRKSSLGATRDPDEM